VRAGAEYTIDDHNRVGVSGNFNRRTFYRSATDYNLMRDARGVVIGDFDRTRYDPEYEWSLEGAATYRHKFAKEDHELSLEFKSSTKQEQEDNHYADIFHLPGQAPTYDNTLIKNGERGTEAIVEYVYPIDDQSKFEAGYTRTDNHLDQDFGVFNFDPTAGRFVVDATRSNRFKHDDVIDAFYVTYARTFDKFGLLAGLRPEQAQITSRLVNTGTSIPNDYSRIYPSLHLTYRLSDKHEVQLNYSHRVRRPESDDLNPFPEYVDPFNLRAGNPRLRPEEIHSMEAGYSFKREDLSLTSTVYHRSLFHGFTSVTRSLGGGVLMTTKENLSESRSTGLELTATTDVGKLMSVNFSSNTFFNTIDASNLGFTSTKSDISWSAKLGASIHLPKSTLLQLNSNYTSSRLTPQGSRLPTYVTNVGLRHDLWQKKAAVVLTVSDLFNSLKEATQLDTPWLKEDIVRRRSARIVYVGFIYNFGKPAKKSKDDGLKFDNAL
jgi:outer membrane receptor protein involved in Fe transport